MNQSKYLPEKLKKYGFENVKSRSTPCELKGYSSDISEKTWLFVR